MIRLAVWNMRFNQNKQKEKFETLAKEADIAIFIESKDIPEEIFDGLEEKFHPAFNKNDYGIRAWVRPESGISLRSPSEEEVKEYPSVVFDSQETNMAVPYIVSKDGADPFLIVAVWTNHNKLDKSIAYKTLLENIILKMQDGSRKFVLPQNDYLIVGDTNLTGEGIDLKEKEVNVRNIVEQLFSENDPTRPKLLDITDGNADEMILENGSEKTSRSTYFHTNEKWYCCDLAIASESMDRRIREKKIGDYKIWHKIVKGKSGSDHLPLFFQIAEK